MTLTHVEGQKREKYKGLTSRGKKAEDTKTKTLFD